MRVYKLERKQVLPIPIEEAWNFFATPKNLDQLTPKDLSFEILSDTPAKMYQGLIIIYKIKLGIVPLNWVTEITHIEDGKYFVDEQRTGPYAMWHHEHHFESTPEGHTLMTDLLHYAVPFGPLGRMAKAVYVGKKVEQIFDDRYKALEELFPKP